MAAFISATLAADILLQFECLCTESPRFELLQHIQRVHQQDRQALTTLSSGQTDPQTSCTELKQTNGYGTNDIQIYSTIVLLTYGH